jgi:hypothetical protein
VLSHTTLTPPPIPEFREGVKTAFPNSSPRRANRVRQGEGGEGFYKLHFQRPSQGEGLEVHNTLYRARSSGASRRITST